MKGDKIGAIAVFAVVAVAGGFYYYNSLAETSKSATVADSVAEPIVDSVAETEADSNVSPQNVLAYDTAAVVRSFESWPVFSENFSVAYKDSSFMGNYQLAFPVDGPYDTLGDSEFNRLLASMFFGKKAPKTISRKSIQTVLDGMMKEDLERTREWWNESKSEYGERWRDEVCSCAGFYYVMPSVRASRWISFQQVADYRCGGNGGPDEKYYTIVYDERSGKAPYVMDTTAFVPGFREKLVDMITDNVIFNRYARYDDDRVNREMIRQAVAEEFKGDFRPTLTLSGVQFLFSTWALPYTSHADGRIPVIVPYRSIQEILTQKFKADIEL